MNKQRSVLHSNPILLASLVVPIVVSTLAIPPFANAQEATPNSEPGNMEANKQAIYRLQDEAITPGNFDLMHELVSADYVQHNPMGDFNADQATALLSGLHSAFSDFKITRAQAVAEGDFVSTRITISGIFDHELASAGGAVPPTGKPIALNIINMFRFDQDGKIAEEWAQFDNLGFLTQLGVMPAPAQ